MTAARTQLVRHRRYVIGAGFLVLAALIVADQFGFLLVADVDDMAAYDGLTVRVVRVVDGDTIIVDAPDALAGRPVTRVRLWGVDSPEITYGNVPPEPLAREAMRFTHEHAHGARITLRLESHRTRGTYGRVLAHVELPDGRCLNAMLLEAGLADLEERWPHDRLVTYAQKYKSAQRSGAGLWADDQ